MHPFSNDAAEQPFNRQAKNAPGVRPPTFGLPPFFRSDSRSALRRLTSSFILHISSFRRELHILGA
jgi:hypothetical protein